MREIGSEFWTVDLNKNYDNNLDFLKFGKDFRLLMSGRTAIDFVLKDFKDNKKVVYMPDYCCESMIQPFKDNGYKIVYYNVDIVNNSYCIDIDFNCSVFFAMSYFGYSISNMDKYIEQFSYRGVVVIEDITHRFLCDINHCKSSTYMIASLRKWFPIISGAVAIKFTGVFKVDISDYTIDEDLVSKRKKAMNLKRQFIDGKFDDKNYFLNLYSESNKAIKYYNNKKIDELSFDILKHLDINIIKKTRIENCNKIESLISKNQKTKLLYKYNKGDCPLFVPIVLYNRDFIRNELVNNGIFLPVHWPNEIDSKNSIYDSELSLVCDQRYNTNDIEEYIKKLIKIVGD